MNIFHSQYRVAVATGGVFLAAMAAVSLLFLAYPYGLIAPDSSEYLEIGRTLLHPQVQISDTARGPALPIALLAATQTPYPSVVIVWMNGFFFALAMAAAAWMMSILSGSARNGFLCGLILLCAEVALAQPFFYTAFVLTDAPSAFLLFAGMLLVFGGWIQSNKTALFCGFLCLGLSEAFRPMLLIPFFGTLTGLWMGVYCRRKQLTRIFIAGCVTALLLPTVSWSIRNAVVYDTVRNPYIGAHLLTHAVRLWTDDDVIFEDPVVNADFHTMLKTHVVPPEYQAPALYGNPDEPWKSINPFLTSQTTLFQSHREHPESVTREQYLREFFPIVARISTQTILRHPLGYLHNVFSQYFLFYRQFQANYLQSFLMQDSRAAYTRIWNDPVVGILLKEFFLISEEVNTKAVSSGASRFLYALSPAIRYRVFFESVTSVLIVFLHLTPLAGLALFFSDTTRTACRLTQKQGRMCGALILIFFGCAVLFYLSIALLTMLNDIRYGAPGMMPLHAVFLLTAGVGLRAVYLRMSDMYHAWQKRRKVS